MIDAHVALPGRPTVPVRKVSPVQTKRGAEQYEREVREAVLAGTWRNAEDERRVPTFAALAAYFLETYAATNNRPSTPVQGVGCSASHASTSASSLRLASPSVA